MFRKIFCTKKIFAILPIIVIGIFLLSTHATHAAGTPADSWSLTGWAWSGIKDSIASFLYTVILTPLAWLLAWAGKLVDFAIQPGTSITGSDFVQAGWRTMRDLTNMVFILVLLGIALDYILFNSVGVKRALPRLLIIALLINFSLPIAGVALDFANVFTSFFIEQAGGAHFTEALATKMNLVTIFNAPKDISSLNVDIATDGVLSSTIFAIFLLIGTLFSFLALAIMFLIRYFFISILLITLPLALVASIIPPLSSTFGKWMRKFFQWTMFAPAAAFFLYLTMVFLGSQMSSITSAIAGGGGTWLSTTGAQITTFVFAWILMFMSLTTAQSMGIIGASTAVTMWNRGSRWAKGKAGSAAAGGAKAGAAAAGRRMKADEQVEKLAKGLQNIPGLGGALSSGVRGIAVKTKTAIEKQETLTTQEKARYEKYSDGQLMAEFNTLEKSPIPGSGAKAAQVAEMLARRGKLLIRDKSGEIDIKASETLATRAYELAKQHRNKNALNAVKRANPLVARRLIAREYGEMARTGKATWYTDLETKERVLKNIDTGKTLKEAQNDVFEMGMGDFENLKGMWSSETVQAFAESGKLTSGFVRKAADIGDEGFINSLEQYLTTLDDEKIEKLRKVNPSLVSFLRKGTAADYIEIPEKIRKEKRGEEQPK